jgi:peptide subunit release factor 1 (eRF1)
VDELLLTAHIRRLKGNQSAPTEEEPIIEPSQAGEPAEAPPEAVRLADELVTKAAQTNARITFIENRDLLADYGGVAALLRFRI